MKEGESPTSGVKTQLGYTTDNVTANNEGLKANSVTDEPDRPQATQYTISEVCEEQNIQVYTLETLEHPTFDKSTEVSGVTTGIVTPEGVLPTDAQMQAGEITEQVEPALAEKVNAESDDRIVVSIIIAYDINLMYDGVKLDNNRAEDGSDLVMISFSGERIEKANMEADQIKIPHLKTPIQEVQAVLTKAELEDSGEAEAVAQVSVLDGISADDIAADSKGHQELDVDGSASVGQIHSQTDYSSAFTVTLKTSPYLVITNELQEDSEGAEEVEYTYKVGITDNRKSKNERLCPLTGDGGAEEYNTTAVTEGDTNIYASNLRPNGEVKAGNVRPLAEYRVAQTIEDIYGESRGTTGTARTKINWIEIDTDLSAEGEGENFPYGYGSNDQYGSLMKRAAILIRVYTECREYDETLGREDRSEQRRTLLRISNNNVTNDSIIVKLLEDHYGTPKWPLASEEGFGGLAGIVSERLKKDNVPDNERPKNLHLYTYFKTADNTENMGIMPYLTRSGTLKDWSAHVASDSQESIWYQYLKAYPVNTAYMISSPHVEGNMNTPKTAHMLIEEDGGNRRAMCLGETPDIGGPIMQSAVDGVISKFDTAYQIEYTSRNYYYNSTSAGDGSTDTGSTDNDFSGNDSSERSDNDSSNGNGNESGEVSGNGTADTDTPGLSAGDTTNTSQGSEGSGSSSGGTTTIPGGTGRYQGTDAQSGPGAQQNVIEPPQVPLASLPADVSAVFSQSMAITDDGKIPLATIPKTGDRESSIHELSFIPSGILMVVCLVLRKKKKES